MIDFGLLHSQDRQGLSDAEIELLQKPPHMLEDDELELRRELVHRVDMSLLFPGPKYRRFFGIFDGDSFYQGDYGIVHVPENFRGATQYFLAAHPSFSTHILAALERDGFGKIELKYPTVGMATVGVDRRGFPCTEVLEVKE